MKSFSQLRLRSRLLWLALVGILPLTLVAGIGLSVIVSQQHEAAQRTTLDLARATGVAVRAELGGAVAVLEALAASPLLDEGRFEAFQALQQRILGTRPDWVAILLADGEGRPLARASQGGGAGSGTPSQLMEPRSFADAVQKGRPLVGAMARGPSGRWGIPVRLPFRAASGQQLVLTAVLGPQVLARVLEEQRMPRDYVASIFDGHGRRVARSVSFPGSIGGPATPSLAELLRSHPVEGSGTTRSLEGVQVHTAFVHLADNGWVVAVGVPSGAVSSSAVWAFAWYGGAILVSAWLSLLVARQFARSIHGPMQQLRWAAQEVEQGKVPSIGAAESWALAEAYEVALSLRSAAQARDHGEELLRVADRRKDAFLATLAHELRNPLAPIRQAAHVLAAPHVELEQRQRCHDIIERQMTHLSLLLDDLLDLARITRGTLHLRKAPCRVGVIVNDAVGMARHVLDAKRHQLSVDMADEEQVVCGDAVRLTQIVANLLTNAGKYTPEAGHIKVTAWTDEAFLVVVVEDNGQGLASTDLERVFEMFTQLPAAPDQLVSGLGVGLSLSRTLAELHDGTLVAASEGQGKGSRFTLRIPRGDRMERADDAAPLVQIAALPPRVGKVLVADDNVDAADTIATLLRLEGYEVEVAYDGEAALTAFQTFAPDAAVLDIGMPKMDGYLVARAVRELQGGREAFLIAVTGWGHDRDIAHAMEAGFNKHLTKPVTIDDLLNLLAQRGRDGQ